MKLLNSFKYAIAGFWYCVKRERNFRIHIIAAIAVIAAAIWFELYAYEVIAIVFAIALVLICEMINTSIERTIDAVRECCDGHDTKKLDGLRKVAKDVAAGAVLVSAVFAAVVGIIIFAGRLF